MPDLIQTVSNESLSPIKSLEAELSDKIKVHGIFDSRVTEARTQLQDSYKSLLIQDFNLVQSSDAESIVWKEIYRVIEEYRRRINKNLARASKHPDEHSQLILDFSTFLIDSSSFYIKLIKELDQEYGLSVLEHVNQINEPLFGLNIELGPNAPKDVDLSVLLKCYQKILIFLGDLARYHELHKIEKSPKKWNVARLYYKCAISIFHTQGNPYNQLAVISSYERDDLAAIYYYYRSIMVSQPFPNAKGNLDVTMSQLLKTGPQLQDLPTNVSNQTLFFKYFLFSHATLFKAQELDAFLTFKPTVISTFKALIRKRELTLEQNLMITSINLASFEYLTYLAKDSSRKSLYQRNAVIFSIDIFEAFLENGIDALDKLSFHRRRQEFLYESLPCGLKRTLPAIYIYIYWAKTNIDFIRTALSSGTLEELGGELCHDSFWRKLKTFTQSLRKIKKKIRQQPSPVILEEEVELSGQLFGNTPFTIPSRILLHGFSKAKSETQAGWRICKLLSAATSVTRISHETGKSVLIEDANLEFEENDSHNVDSSHFKQEETTDTQSSGPFNNEEFTEKEASDDNVGGESSDDDNFVFKGRIIPNTPPSPKISVNNDSSPIIEPLASTQSPHELSQPNTDCLVREDSTGTLQMLFGNSKLNGEEARSKSPAPFTSSLESYVDKLVEDVEVADSMKHMHIDPTSNFGHNNAFPGAPFQYSQFNPSFYPAAAPPMFPFGQQTVSITRNNPGPNQLRPLNHDIWAPPSATFSNKNNHAYMNETKGDKARRVSESNFFGNSSIFPVPQSTSFEQHSFSSVSRPPPPGFAPSMPRGMSMTTGSRNSLPHPYKPASTVGDEVATSSFNHLFNTETYQGFLGR